MSNFANVNIGAAANDTTGDPLRNAFQKINTNFANIPVGGSGVSTVAGRSGNVVLNVNDVVGAASTYYVADYVAAGNAYVDSQVAALGNISVVALVNDINALDANVGVLSTNVSALFINAASQTTSLNNLANDINGINSTLVLQQNNINAVSASVNTLFANAATQQTSISALFANAVAQQNNITSVGQSVVTANTAMTTYVNNFVTDTVNVAKDNINHVGNVSVIDQTVAGMNDGNPLVIEFSLTQIRGDLTVESTLIANAISNTTNTNVGSILIPQGGLGVAGNIYCGTQPGSRLQVGTGGQLLPDVLGQFTSNVNSYAQINMQNLNHGPFSSSDFVATADNGNDSSHFIDMGIASSNYYFPDYPGYKPNDGYLLVNGGNLLINADTTDKTIRFLVGGHADSDQVGQFSASGLSVDGDIAVTGNVSFTMGNITNWTTPVSTIGAALDQLAARLKAAGF